MGVLQKRKLMSLWVCSTETGKLKVVHDNQAFFSLLCLVQVIYVCTLSMEIASEQRWCFSF